MGQDWHVYDLSCSRARDPVERFLDPLGFEWVVMGECEYTLALDAYVQYGKGRHPAQLNLGDCFAAARAKSNRAKLFEDDDFTTAGVAPWLAI